jgi:hypothetical protein
LLSEIIQEIVAFMKSDIANTFGQLAVAIGLAGSVWGLWQQRRVLQTYVALDFFKRYEAWNEDAPYALDERTCLDDLDDQTRDEVLHSVLRYANLCSEEFSLYKAGRVPRDIWEIWDYGIRQNFQKPIWREAWTEKRMNMTRIAYFKSMLIRSLGNRR